MSRKGQKKCRQCGDYFTPFNTLQPCCSPRCAIEWSKSKEGSEHVAKERRKETREKKQALDQSSRRWWLDEKRSGSAQYWCHRFIRLRDAGRGCISCGIHTGQMHAGHYRTKAAAPELRLEPLNIHLQCSQCNNSKSGNLIEYRINLVLKIGAAKVAWLEGPHEPKHYTVDDLREIRDHFKTECKELEAKAA